MSELGDYGVTREIEDAIRAIARAEVMGARPQPRYALVKAINTTNRTAQVQYNGDSTLVWVPYGSEQPAYINQPVLIEGTAEDRRISQVIGNTQSDVDLAALSATIDWLVPSLVTGATSHAANPPRYRKIRVYGTDFIQLKGRINTTAAVNTLWNMPVGYRPVVNLAPILIGRDTAGGSNVAQLEVLANGTVALVGKTVGANGLDTATVDPVDETTVAGEHRHFEYNGGNGGFSDWNGPHKHGVTGAHSHAVPSVVAPTFISLDGVQYAI